MLWKFWFHCTLSWSCLPGPQPPVNENEGLSCPSRTGLHTDLQHSLFPSEPSKHDPLLSQAIPPSPHWWVSKLLKFPSPDTLWRWPGLCLALLRIVQGHRWGEEGGRQSIYQDVLLYFFYPSLRRWFYFSENPLNSDQVRWLLSLETQALSGHNQYKCWTPKWGPHTSVGFLGIFLVMLAFFFLLYPIIFILGSFQLFSSQVIKSGYASWNESITGNLGIVWRHNGFSGFTLLLTPGLKTCLPIRIPVHTWVITETWKYGVHKHAHRLWSYLKWPNCNYTILWSPQYANCLSFSLGYRVQCKWALQPP